MLNYGIRMYWMLSSVEVMQPDNGEKEVVRLIARWVIVVTGVLSIIFTVRSVFNLLFIFGLIPRFFPEEITNPVFWDSIVSLVF